MFSGTTTAIIRGEKEAEESGPAVRRSARGFVNVPGCQKQNYTDKHTHKHREREKNMHLDTMQTVYLKIETTANRNSLVFKSPLTFGDKNRDAVLRILCAVMQNYKRLSSIFILYLDSDR